MKKLNVKKLAGIIACVCTLGLASQVSALNITSSPYLGHVTPGTPAAGESEAIFINALRILALGQTNNAVVAHNGSINTAVRSSFDLGSLPEALEVGAAKDDTNPSNSVDISGYSYLLGKYGNNAYVWYVGDLDGVVEIPTTFGPSQGLSHWSVYNATTITRVPDGGSTLALIGLAVAGLGFMRRKMA